MADFKTNVLRISNYLTERLPSHWDHEVVYRPLDLGIFGADGYTIYFMDRENPKTRVGINSKKMFTRKMIDMIIDKIERERKDRRLQKNN